MSRSIFRPREPWEVEEARAAASEREKFHQALIVICDVAATTADAHRIEGRKILADQIDAALLTVKKTAR